MNFDLDSLKNAVQEAKLVNYARIRAKPFARNEIKRLIKELKLAKSAYNHLLKDIKESKRRIKRFKSYVGSYDRNLKEWSSRNVGKLINSLTISEETK